MLPPLPPRTAQVSAATTLPSLEAVAMRYARTDPDASERELAMLTERAILGWKLEEAAFWQRVKFRSRMLRARARGAGSMPPRDA